VAHGKKMSIFTNPSPRNPLNWRGIFLSPPARSLGLPTHEVASLKRSVKIGSATLRILKGHLADADVSVIVVPLDADLTIANPTVMKSLFETEGASFISFQNLIPPPVETGKTFISSARNLYAKQILFLATGGPRGEKAFIFERKDPLARLEFCLSRALDKIEKMGLKSLALPVIGDNFLDMMTIAQKMVEILCQRGATSPFGEIQIILENKTDFYIFDAALEARLAQDIIFKGEAIAAPRIDIIGKDDAAKIDVRVIYGEITRIGSDALIVAVNPDENLLSPVNLDIIKCTAGRYHAKLYKDPEILEHPIAQNYKADRRFHTGAFNNIIFVPDIASLSVKEMVLLGLKSAHLGAHQDVCLAPMRTENAPQNKIIEIAHEIREAIEQFRAENPKTTVETIRIVGTDSIIIEPFKQVITP
jgi:hypothetical protein